MAPDRSASGSAADKRDFGMGGIAGQDDPLLTSALVCTCGRGRLVVDTVSSIFANTHPNFELAVERGPRDTGGATAIQQAIPV